MTHTSQRDDNGDDYDNDDDDNNDNITPNSIKFLFIKVLIQ
jgi:hypothetical protein